MAGQLLFDENLSPRLATALGLVFPGSQHVRDAKLKGASDREIWDFAQAHDFTIVSKDDDFRALSLLYGAPPKVIWLIIGNSSTAEIIALLLNNSHIIEAFLSEEETSLLPLCKPAR